MCGCIPPSTSAPGEPTIHGYDASELVKVGAALNLTCSSGGGFPRAKLTWLKNGEVIPSETVQEGGNSVAVVEVTVEGPDNETEYLCRAYNFVADFSASVVVRVEQGEGRLRGSDCDEMWVIWCISRYSLEGMSVTESVKKKFSFGVYIFI